MWSVSIGARRNCFHPPNWLPMQQHKANRSEVDSDGRADGVQGIMSSTELGARRQTVVDLIVEMEVAHFIHQGEGSPWLLKVKPPPVIRAGA